MKSTIFAASLLGATAFSPGAPLATGPAVRPIARATNVEMMVSMKRQPTAPCAWCSANAAQNSMMPVAVLTPLVRSLSCRHHSTCALIQPKFLKDLFPDMEKPDDPLGAIKSFFGMKEEEPEPEPTPNEEPPAEAPADEGED